MQNNPDRSKIDPSAIYQITVRGRLDSSWTEWFDGLSMTITKDKSGSTLTTLTGPVADQSALHGLLARLRDLGLTLLDVHCLDAGKNTVTPPSTGNPV